MAKYFVLSVDSFTNSFSILGNGKNIYFSMKVQGDDNVISSLRTGDYLAVYSRKPDGKFRIILQADNTNGTSRSFKKVLEVGAGADGHVSGVQDLDHIDVTEISEQQYNAILRNMLSTLVVSEEISDDEEDVPRIKGGKNILFYGVPGSGKSYAISKICDDESVMERVVFHPDYSYSDFVGQIMPRLNEDNKLEYVFTPGPFTKIMYEAEHNPSKMFYLIIEEINRGNAPAIFGEIFQLLDRKDAVKYPGEEDESEYGISNYDIAKEVYDGDANHLVRIPSNLTILATMNTSDQNVFTLDTAFQRRWDMKHTPNKFTDGHAFDLIEGSNISWGSFAYVINDLVVEINADMGGSGDKRLGAYFAKLDELSNVAFSEKVLKYLWDDAFKMDKQMVFDKRMTSLDKVLDAYQNAQGDPLKAVLKGDVYQKMNDQANGFKSSDMVSEGDVNE